MATNLRLRPELEAAVRVEAKRSRRSQQEVIRAAIESYLQLDDGSESSLAAARRAYAQRIRPARTPFMTTTDRIILPDGLSSLDLLQREDRI